MPNINFLLYLTQPVFQAILAAMLLGWFWKKQLDVPRAITFSAGLPILLGLLSVTARQVITGRDASIASLLLTPLMFYPISLLVSTLVLTALFLNPNGTLRLYIAASVAGLVGIDLLTRALRIDLFEVR
jgi:hypothetical protein